MALIWILNAAAAATIYLEMWSRRQSRLAWEWDLMETEFGENEEVRVEYEMTTTRYRISPITKQREPYLPIWQRAGRFALSGSGVIFLVNIARHNVLNFKKITYQN